jgi:RNA polymerase-associated protein CTR9
MLNLSTGRLDQAKFFFQTTLKQCGPVLPALLGMAAVCYGDRDYRQAQQKYGEAIRQYPEESGAPARVGFGLACYRLGQVDRAKAAFARALAMDPECVEAMVGTALLGMAGVDEGSPAFSQETEKAIKMLSMANLLDHSNAMVQNHLANHYFWKWTPVTGTVQVAKGSRLVRASQPMPLDPNERIRIGNKFETTVLEDPSLGNDDDSYQFLISDAWKEDGVGDGDGAGGLKVWKKDYDRVTALAKGAYASTAVQEIQAESLFFLARVYHVRDEMDSAHKVYEKACKLAPDLAPARFGLAQTLVVKGQHDAAMAHLASILDKPSGTATDALALLGLLEVKSGGTKFDEGLAHVRKAIDLDPLNPRLLALEALALRQRRSTYGEALERYRGAIELTQRHRRERVPHDVYANAGVLCHETKRYDDAMAMYRLALDALDGGGLMREPTLDNAGVEGGRVREDDNDMFCGYVDSFVEAQRDPESDVSWKVTSPAGGDGSALSLRVGDRIRIADSFVSEIVEIVESEDGSSLSLVVKDAVRVAEDSEEDGDGMASHPVFVVRENQILKIPEALTIAFNIARLHEVRGRTLAAIELHKAILKRSPSYVNSSLRLACIAVDCGSLKECGEWLKIAAATAPSNPEVLTLIGNLHLSLCDWAAAQPVFDGLLAKKDSKVEAYAALSLGNICTFQGGMIPSRSFHCVGTASLTLLRARLCQSSREREAVRQALAVRSRLLQEDPGEGFSQRLRRQRARHCLGREGRDLQGEGGLQSRS